jgi:D-galactarolactone cycloisomerase
MKITKVEAIPLRYEIATGWYGGARSQTTRREACLVVVDTDEGLYGVGECFGPALVTAAHVQELSALFLGQDPFDRERLWTAATNSRYHIARGWVQASVLSGLDIACWDLMGKYCEQPAAKLLGGWNRDSVTPYASTGYFSGPEDGFRASIESAVEEGFDFLGQRIRRHRNGKVLIKPSKRSVNW